MNNYNQALSHTTDQSVRAVKHVTLACAVLLLLRIRVKNNRTQVSALAVHLLRCNDIDPTTSTELVRIQLPTARVPLASAMTGPCIEAFV